MAYELTPFRSIPLDEPLLRHLLERHEQRTRPKLARLWRYYRNALAEPAEHGGSTGAPAQRMGLPARLRHRRASDRDTRTQPEVVIENDIAWRLHTLVDFMFPQAPRLMSRAGDPARRRLIERVLEAILNGNGGVMLLQDAALLGAVYGSVDFVVNAEALFASPRVRGGASRGEAASQPFSHDETERLASMISIEAVEAPRAIPLLHPDDFRRLDAYILHHEREVHALETASLPARLLRFSRAGRSARARSMRTVILSARHAQVYDDEHLIETRPQPLGRIPVVHVQNLSLPFHWEGLSDVEPLIPLQDELNTRLSDRAYRVTMQSFRMYLGKGIDGFIERPIGPGQMWMTDNTTAAIEAFGGDAESPSETAHIEQLREALDKASGVTPAAAGHIKAKVGNLTSENALRISLMGTIAKVKRKRITYGRGLCELAELLLHALHISGHLPTASDERLVEVVWPDPLPTDESRRLEDALRKQALGVPRDTLLAELGYGESPSP